MKIPRSYDDPGKGNYWTLDPHCDQGMTGHPLSKLRKKGIHGSLFSQSRNLRRTSSGSKVVRREVCETRSPNPALVNKSVPRFLSSNKINVTSNTDFQLKDRGRKVELDKDRGRKVELDKVPVGNVVTEPAGGGKGKLGVESRGESEVNLRGESGLKDRGESGLKDRGESGLKDRGESGLKEGSHPKIGPPYSFRSMSHLLQVQANFVREQLRLKQQQQQSEQLNQLMLFRVSAKSPGCFPFVQVSSHPSQQPTTHPLSASSGLGSTHCPLPRNWTFSGHASGYIPLSGNAHSFPATFPQLSFLLDRDLMNNIRSNQLTQHS